MGAGAPPEDPLKPAPQEPDPKTAPAAAAATSPPAGQAPAADTPPAGEPAAAPSTEPAPVATMDEKVGQFYTLLADGEMAPYFDGAYQTLGDSQGAAPPATSAAQPQEPPAAATPAQPDADLRRRAEEGDSEALATLGQQLLERDRVTAGQAVADEATHKAEVQVQRATLERLGVTRENLTGPEMQLLAEQMKAGKTAFDAALAVHASRVANPAAAAPAADPAAPAPNGAPEGTPTDPAALVDFGRRIAASNQAATPALAGGQAVTEAPPPNPSENKSPLDVIEEALEAEAAAATKA